MRRRIVWPRRRLPNVAFPPIELDPTGLALLVLLPIVLAGILVTVASAALLVIEAVVVVIAAYVWKGRWIIEATTKSGSDETKTWAARGWTASRRKLEAVARELAA